MPGLRTLMNSQHVEEVEALLKSSVVFGGSFVILSDHSGRNIVGKILFQ